MKWISSILVKLTIRKVKDYFIIDGKEEICNDLEYSQIENFEKIIHQTSKKINLEINQYIVEGKIEEFALEKINLEGNILSTDITSKNFINW